MYRATGVRVGELLALQWKDIDWNEKTITFSRGFWRGRLQESTKTGQEHVRHMPRSLERVFADHLQSSTNIGPNDFVFCRSAEDSRPHDPDDLKREVLYPFSTDAGSSECLARTAFMLSDGRRASICGRPAVSSWQRCN